MTYALGYHQAWEVFLHQRLQKALEENQEAGDKKQTEWISMFMQQYPKHYDQMRLCTVCSAQIESALASGEDPFKPTPFFRRALVEFGQKLERREKWKAK